MNSIAKRIAFLVLVALTSTIVYGQEQPLPQNRATDQFSPIITAVPSLSIAPDARGGGMGDIGAATMPDLYSQHWNPAKYAFIKTKAGATLSYTPWLSKLVSDIDMVYLSGFYRFGSEDKHALSASLRYFSVGDIPETTLDQLQIGVVSPYEMAVDVAYSLKMTETFAGGVALRYIRTDFSSSKDETTTPGNAIAADISGYNESYVMLGQSESMLGLGFNISNIGSKISTDGGNSNYFLPTNMRLGAALTYPLDDRGYNSLSVGVDFNKLLVPSRPVQGADETDEDFKTRAEAINETSSISGIFKSFSDSPYGLKGELEEIAWSLGAEYSYNNQFQLRGGYFHESEKQGNRRYFSFGAGFKLSVFQIDAAYLVSSAQSNPLDQTLRFSLGFNMDGLKSLFK